MDIFTHMFMGVLAGLFTLTILSPEAIILLWVMSFFPDLDIFLEPFQKVRKSYYLSHKAASHSYIVGIFLAGIFSLIIFLVRNSSFIEVWLAGFIGYCIHVSLDFFGASKTPIFYPISKKEFRFIADRAVNPLLATFSGINLLVFIAYYYIKPYFHVFMELGFFYLYVYVIYFGIRALLRIIIQASLSNNQQYIPGFLPFFYLIYKKNITPNNITFKLKKRFVFSLKEQELINQNILDSTVDMTFFELAKKISQEYRFFHKWDLIIPFIRKNEDSVNVVLILAESFSQSIQHKSFKRNVSSYYLSIIFAINTKQIISKIDGFGSFKKWENLDWS